MTGVKILALPTVTTPLSGAEAVPLVQSGVTKQATVNNISAGRPIIVTHITELRALTPNPTTYGVLAELISNWTAGDGGGLFRYDSTDTTSADNGGTIIVDAGGYRWKREVRDGMYQASWWGSTFAALQSALAAAILDGQKLFINPGTWTTATDYLAVTGDIEIFGVRGLTKLVRTGDVAVPMIYVTGASANYVTIHDLYINSTSNTAIVSSFNAGICGYNVTNLDTYNVDVVGKFYVGITYDGITKGTIYGCTTKSMVNRGFYIYRACYDITITNCSADMTDAGGAVFGNYGLNTNPGGVTSPRRLAVTNFTTVGFSSHGCAISEDYEELVMTNITGSSTGGSSVGFVVQAANGFSGRKAVFSNISFSGCFNNFVFTGTNDFVCSNLMSSTAQNDGILVTNCRRGVLNGVVSKSSTGRGIYVTGDAASDTTDLIFNGGSFHDNGSQGMYCYANNANGIRRVTVMNSTAFSNATYGFISNANCDAVRFLACEAYSNATANIATGGTLQAVIDAGIPIFYDANGFQLLTSTAIPAAGTADLGIRISNTPHFGIFFGSGAPTLSAAKGSIYMRSDGTGVNDRAYINTNAGTTWTAIVTVA